MRAVLPGGRGLVADVLLPGRLATTFVFIHGLASVREGQKSDAIFGLARRLGAGAIRVDMTGPWGESPGNLAEVTLTRWIEDVEIALRHARSLSGADGAVVLLGYSFGGLAAAHALAKRSESVPADALVLLAPALGLLERLEKVHEPGAQFLHLPSRYLPDGRLTLSATIREDLRCYPGDDDLAQRLKQTPLMIVHGEGDDTVPVDLALAFHGALSSGETGREGEIEKGKVAENTRIAPEFILISETDGGDHRMNVPIADICRQTENFLQHCGLINQNYQHLPQLAR